MLRKGSSKKVCPNRKVGDAGVLMRVSLLRRRILS